MSACAAGQNDATSREHSPRVIDASVGSVRVANVQIVAANGAALPSASPTDTSSASPSASPSASSSAGSGAQGYLTLTVSSTQDDELTGAAVAGGGTVTPTSSGSLTVTPGQLLIIGDPQAGSSGPALAVSGLPQAPIVGSTVAVTLYFRNAGSVTVQAPVRESQPA